MHRRRSSLAALIAVEPHALGVSGPVFGSLWGAGAVAAWLIVALPELAINRPAILVTAVVTTCVAAWSWSLSGRPAERWVAPVSLAAGLPFAAWIIAETGGALSPGRGALIFAVVFAAWAFPLGVALVWEILTLMTFAAPLAYSEGAERMRFAAEVLVQGSHWLGVAFAVVLAKRMLLRAQARSERLAGEQLALRRIATAAAASPGADSVFALVAEEAARTSGAPAAAIVAAEPEVSVVVATWFAGSGPPTGAGSLAAQAAEPLEAARVALGSDGVLAVPVQVEGRDWGVIAVACTQPATGAEDRLREVAELLGLAIAAGEGRRRLAEQAASDVLTGLANRRAFDARFAAEVARAQRHGSPLVLVLVDLDNLKQVNDRHGHAAGDAQLQAVADALRAVARGEDLVARLGGDEFVWLLPDTAGHEALPAVERLRSGPCPPVSIGVAELGPGVEAADLLHNADAALYAAKEAGRGTTRAFTDVQPGSTRSAASEPFGVGAQPPADVDPSAGGVDAADPEPPRD